MATGPAHVRLVGIVIEYVAHDTGHWCNTCLLSTGIRVWVAVISTHERMHLQERLHCYECSGRDVTVAADAGHG